MHEPARHAIPFADPSPTLRRPSDNRGPGWPTAGSRPPHARQPDEPPADPPPPDPAVDSGHPEARASQLDPDSPPADTRPSDEPADDTWLTDTPPTQEQADDTWLIDALSPDERAEDSWRPGGPLSEQLAARSGTTADLPTAEPAGSRTAGGRLRGWPLSRARKKSALPPDWPPPDAPRPEDEPTIPIEGLNEAARAPGDFPEMAEGRTATPAEGLVEHRATNIDEPTDELPIIGRFEEGPPPAPGNRWLVGAGVTAALLLLIGAGALARDRTGNHAADYREGVAIPSAAAAGPAGPASDGGDPSVSDPSAQTPAAGPGHSATAPLDGRTESGFDLVDAADAVVLRTADLGGDLYRVVSRTSTPRVTDENGRIRLFLEQGNTSRVEIALSSRVRWQLRVGGGADLRTIDLSGARLAAVDLAGSATRINLLLPRPDGTLTVRMSGGVGQFDVHNAGQVPVRLRFGSGAGQVVVDGTSHSGVAAGALFTPDRWDEAEDRIDVDAVAGMSRMIVGP